jgi:hypothetical protein
MNEKEEIRKSVLLISNLGMRDEERYEAKINTINETIKKVSEIETQMTTHWYGILNCMRILNETIEKRLYLLEGEIKYQDLIETKKLSKELINLFKTVEEISFNPVLKKKADAKGNEHLLKPSEIFKRGELNE